jgi:hypothetical protein
VTTGTPVRRAVVTGTDLEALRSRVSDVQAWPAGSHRYGHYAEHTATGPAVCRTENVSACHAGVARLVQGPLSALAAAELGGVVVDFKDKLNYKQPGGAGFSPHQDLLAYPGVSRVVSVLLAIDECTTSSGCVWVAPAVDEPLPVDDRGVVAPQVAAALSWVPAELAPGDALCIAGLLPHFSEANHGPRPRRVLVASYAPAGEGYGRDRYYAARALAMHQARDRDARFRISTLADFEGMEVVGAPGAAGDACSHGRVPGDASR